MDMKGTREHTGPVPGRSDTCAICQKQIESNQATLIHDIPCGTPFHKRCLKDHLARNGNCPNCRGEIRKTLDDDTRWHLFLEWHTEHEALEKQALIDGTIPTLYRSSGWKAHSEFAKGCMNSKDFFEATNRSILDVYNDSIRLIEDAKALATKEIKSAVHLQLGDLSVEMSRRTMAGEGPQAITEGWAAGRLEIETEVGEHTEKRLRDLEQQMVRIEDNTVVALQEAKETLSEMVGYHWAVLQEARDGCSRAGEWEDIPYPVS